MNSNLRPKYIKCNQCGYKERKRIEEFPRPDIDSIHAIFLSICRHCDLPTISFAGDLSDPKAMEFIEGFADENTLIGQSPYKS